MTSVRSARSANWRVNSSSVKAVEGAYVLRALKKVAGAVGLPAACKVRFNTSPTINTFDPETDDVKVAGGDVFTKAPIPPENLDVLVGRTIHGVEHYTINTVGVWFSCQPKVPESERELFKAFVHIGEDIIIDYRLTSNRNLKDYYDAAMEYGFRSRRKPHANSLLELWIEYAFRDPHIIYGVPDEMTYSLERLAELTAKLRVPMDRSGGIRIRADLYVQYWEEVRDVVLHPPELEEGSEGGGDGLPEQLQSSQQNNQGGQTWTGATDQHPEHPREDLPPPMHMNPAPIDQRLAEAIEEAMVSDTEDITKQIYDEFAEAGFDSRSTRFLITRKHETKTPPIKPDPEQCRRLERILTIRKRLQARVMRGESYGKLDMRKLHRSQTDEKMFKLRYRFPEGFPDAAILVDMSGSMSGKQAQEVIAAATSLATVVKCKVWSYSESSSEIRLVKLDDGRATHACAPSGNTPSGVALVSVADTLKRGGLIIHLTDGEHNVEFGPVEATQILNKKGINAVHLLWGEKAGPYENLPCRLLTGGLTEFPEALYWILVEQLRLGGIGLRSR